MNEKELNIPQLENEAKEAEQRIYRFVVGVKFKRTKKAYSFGSDDETIALGDHVVVETVRGIELGEVVSELRLFDSENSSLVLKPVIRKATEKDHQEYEQNRELAKEAMTKCAKAIESLQLDMHLIDAEFTLDRSKVIFVYVSDERVDFRELLKELTTMFKCRIELRQIGPRDKAKMVGGLGSCGMETCCSRFLNDFEVVSINMAKNQLLALNIQKLSGQCGKLLCCLKYEDKQYKELREGLPKLNSQITYKGKQYRITSMNVLTKQAKIENREDIQFLSFAELFPDR